MPLEILVLTDGRATAKILPGFGFNCFSYEVERNGTRTDLLWAHPNFGSGNESASGSGIPILFPFPGRIEGTVLHYQGEDYPLEAGDGAGNAIHGFVLDRPWRVLEATPTRAVGQFQASVDDATLLVRWPNDFCITVTYSLRDGALVSEFRIDNPGAQPLPFGLGTHAYFRLPVAADAVADQCLVTVPATRAWELIDLRPTGRQHDVQGPNDLTDGKPFRDCQLDDVLTGLQFIDGHCATTIRDPASNETVVQTFDDTFPHCVVYTPPHREAICMEPYTCVPDSCRLEQEGAETGLRRLEPGHTFRTQVTLRVATLAMAAD
jgi:aldose 1-epimerase